MGNEPLLRKKRKCRRYDDIFPPTPEILALRREVALEAIREMFGPYCGCGCGETKSLENLLQEVMDRLESRWP